MQITNFRDLYMAELQELRSAELQLIETWRRAAEVAANPRLTNVLVRHGEETQLQKERLRCCNDIGRIRRPIRTKRCRRSFTKPKR